MLDLGGTFRECEPEQTLEKLTPRLWDDFGITRVADVTGLDDIDIPTFISVRPQSRVLTTSQGKGINKPLAKISAIMEAIEIWHAERAPEPALYGSYNDLAKRYNLLYPDQVLSHASISTPNVEKMSMYWSRGTELNSGKTIYFPYTLIHLNLTSVYPGFFCFPPSSNGLAAGNSYEEAVCHGLLEVIERECESHFDPLDGQNKPVDLASVDDAHIQQLVSILQKHPDIELFAWDITNELNIPAYNAILHDKEGIRSVGIQQGGGAHFSSHVALSRAITEAVQSRLTLITGSRDDMFPWDYEGAQYYDNLNIASTTQPFVDRSLSPSSFQVGIDHILKRLQDQGYDQAIVYNHTRDDIGINVVHTLIPGFHFDIARHGDSDD